VNQQERESRQRGSANHEAMRELDRQLTERGTVKWDPPISDDVKLAAWRENLPNRQ